MSDKVVYPVYGGDDIPYEPSYLRVIFESREEAKKYVKELNENEEKLDEKDMRYADLEQEWFGWYDDTHEVYFEDIADSDAYNKAKKEIMDHFNITKEMFNEVAERPPYVKQIYHVGPEIPFFPQRD